MPTKPNTYFSAPKAHIQHWTDTLIKVWVPSINVMGNGDNIAGTGKIKVINIEGVESDFTTEILTIPYSVKNAKLSPTNTIRRVELHGQLNGGYRIVYDTSMTNNQPALAAFRRALETWRCSTGINIFDEDDCNGIALSSSRLNMRGFIKVAFVTNQFETPNFTFGTNGKVDIMRVAITNCGDSIVIASKATIFFSPERATDWYYGNGETINSDQYDFESVALHELGHFHQMNHILDESKLMFPVSGLAMQNIFLEDDPAKNGGNAVMNYSTNQDCSFFPPMKSILDDCEIGDCRTGSIDFETEQDCDIDGLVIKIRNGTPPYLFAGDFNGLVDDPGLPLSILASNLPEEYEIILIDGTGYLEIIDGINDCQDHPDPDCNDGIQNGNEEGIDCGGSFCEPCPCFTAEDFIGHSTLRPIVTNCAGSVLESGRIRLNPKSTASACGFRVTYQDEGTSRSYIYDNNNTPIMEVNQPAIDLFVTDLTTNQLAFFNTTTVSNYVKDLTVSAVTEKNTGGPTDCDGSISLTPNNAVGNCSYQWDCPILANCVNGASAQNQLCAGSYHVTVTDGDNCSATRTYTIRDQGSGGLGCPIDIKHVEINPNPVGPYDGIVYIKYVASLDFQNAINIDDLTNIGVQPHANLTIYNTGGNPIKTVVDGPINIDQLYTEPVDVTDLSAGVYIASLRLTCGARQARQSLKIVKF